MIGEFFWVAHASRVLAMASRHRELSCYEPHTEKAYFGGTPKPLRETRALPKQKRRLTR